MISFHELLKRPLLIYLAHFGTFFKIILISLIFNVAINVVSAPSLALTLKLTAPLTPLSILLTAWAELALVRTFFGYSQGESPTAGPMLSAALKKLPGFVIILILWFLAVITGLVFVIVPGIIFATWFLFVSSAYMIENTPISGVFRRSKALVSPYFLSIFWRIALASIIFVSILWTASRGIEFFLELLKTNPTISYNLASGASAILGALLLPAYIGVVVTMYLDVRQNHRTLIPNPQN